MACVQYASFLIMKTILFYFIYSQFRSNNLCLFCAMQNKKSNSFLLVCTSNFKVDGRFLLLHLKSLAKKCLFIYLCRYLLLVVQIKGPSILGIQKEKKKKKTFIFCVFQICKRVLLLHVNFEVKLLRNGQKSQILYKMSLNAQRLDLPDFLLVDSFSVGFI